MLKDFYTKAVLSIIAVALSIIALNPWIAPTKVEAAATSQDGVLTAILAVVTQIANGSYPDTKILSAHSEVNQSCFVL